MNKYICSFVIIILGGCNHYSKDSLVFNTKINIKPPIYNGSIKKRGNKALSIDNDAIRFNSQKCIEYYDKYKVVSKSCNNARKSLKKTCLTKEKFKNGDPNVNCLLLFNLGNTIFHNDKLSLAAWSKYFENDSILRNLKYKKDTFYELRTINHGNGISSYQLKAKD